MEEMQIGRIVIISNDKKFNMMKNRLNTEK
jgi:hypothetical protein